MSQRGDTNTTRNSVSAIEEMAKRAAERMFARLATAAAVALLVVHASALNEAEEAAARKAKEAAARRAGRQEAQMQAAAEQAKAELLVEGFRTEAVRSGTTRPTRGIHAKRSGRGRRWVKTIAKTFAPGGHGLGSPRLSKPTTTGATALPKHRSTGHAKQITAPGSPPRNASGRSVCPGVTIQHRVHGSVTIQWAHTEEEYATIVAAVERVAGGAAELVCNPKLIGCGRGWAARWQFVRSTLQQLGVRSMLEVGGIGSRGPYFKHFEYACVNVQDYQGCQRYHGDKLRHTNGSFDGVLVESTLHHAAEQTLPLLKDIRRVARRWVLVGEDLLDRGSGGDVFAAYREHDPKAIYRSLVEWAVLFRLVGFKLQRIYYLHRVPMHVRSRAASGRDGCRFSAPPMSYFLLTTE